MATLYDVFSGNDYQFILRASADTIAKVFGLQSGVRRIVSEANEPKAMCKLHFNGRPPQWCKEDYIVVCLASDSRPLVRTAPTGDVPL